MMYVCMYAVIHYCNVAALCCRLPESCSVRVYFLCVCVFLLLGLSVHTRMWIIFCGFCSPSAARFIRL
jgi:hypothetical protein